MRQLPQDNQPGLPKLPAKNGSGGKVMSSSLPADDVIKEMRKLNVSQESSRTSADSVTQSKDEPMGAPVLPQEFVVKYLGKRDAGGLWGIKHTRKPVDEMVAQAKEMKMGDTLPFLQMTVSEKGVQIDAMPKNINNNYEGGFYPIDVISYGVQDLVYTRVFAMILVKEEASVKAAHPFQCYAFVCDSRHNARKLTFALAQAFQQFSKEVKGNKTKKPKKFAIDLRSPEEIEADMREADSEA